MDLIDTSYFETKIGQQLDTDMRLHIGVIVGFLNETNIKNFAYLKAQVDLDSTDSNSDSDSDSESPEKTIEEMIADPTIAIRRKLSWFSYVMEDKSILTENPFLLKIKINGGQYLKQEKSQKKKQHGPSLIKRRDFLKFAKSHITGGIGRK